MTTPKIDLRDPERRAAFDAEVLAAVADGQATVGAIRKTTGGANIQISGALGRLIDAGKVERTEDGQYRRRKVSTAAAPPETKGKRGRAEQAKAKLTWKQERIRGRATVVAPWGDGVFRIVLLSEGKGALFYEVGESTAYDYGCGQSRALKGLARELATMGVPTPAEFAKAGGMIGACPTERARTTRLGDVELTWRETIAEGRQVCVAATGDGEFRIVQSPGGSFALIFAREGDEELESLGCGARGVLETRAMQVLADVAAEEVEGKAATEAGATAGTPPGEAAAETSAEDDAVIAKALGDALASMPF